MHNPYDLKLANTFVNPHSQDVPDAVAGAKWVWSSDDPDQPYVWVWFRKRFNISNPASARVHLTADQRYQLWVNGQRVGIGPPKHHEDTPTLDSYDVSHLVEPGENLVAVLAYSVTANAGLTSIMPRRGGLLASIEADGQVLASEASWKARREIGYPGPGEDRHDMQPASEVFDARVALGPAWLPDFDDSSWPDATELSDGPLRDSQRFIEPRDIPHLPWEFLRPDRVIETGSFKTSQPAREHDMTGRSEDIASAVRRPDHDGRVTHDRQAHSLTLDASSLRADEGVYALWDFGTLWTGLPVITVSGEPGTIVDLSCGEHLQHGRLDPAKSKLAYTDRLILGDEPITFRVLWPKCTQYLQADVTHGKATIHRIGLDVMTYPVEWAGTFRCSDMALDHAWKLCAHTTQLCMEDGYMDTPWRERGTWLGDILVTAAANYYAFGDKPLMRRFLRGHARGMMTDGAMTGKFPAAKLGTINTWTLSYAIAVLDYLNVTGDVDIAREVWPTVLKNLEWLEQYRTADGLYGDLPYRVTLDFNVYTFIDWAPVKMNHGTSAGFNAYACRFFDACAALAELLDEDGKAAQFRDRRAELSQLYRELFWDSERGIFTNGRIDGKLRRRWGVHENYFAIVFDIASDEQRQSIWQRLRQEDLLTCFYPKAEDYDEPVYTMALAEGSYRWDDEKMVPLGTPYFAYWALLALCDLGLHDDALAMIRKNWGDFARQGGTSIWEQWDTTSSLSHAFGAGPLIVLSRYVLGVNLAQRREGVIDVLPQRMDLDWARGRVPVVEAGTLEVDWRWDQDGWSLTVDVPQGVQIRFGVPEQDVDAATLQLNGEPVAEPIRVQQGPAVYLTATVSAGRHELVARTIL